MRNIIFISILFILITACNNRSELKYLDVNYHRTYQDTTISAGKTYSQRISAVKRVINEYLDLNYLGKDTSSFYFYLVGRAYAQGVEPFNLIVFDTVNRRLIDSNFYRLCIDSSLYFQEKALKLDSLNVMSMYSFVRTLRNEMYNHAIGKDDGLDVPYSFERDSRTWNQRLNYVFNHALAFNEKDTTPQKIRSRFIVETALMWLSTNFEKYSLSSLDNSDNTAVILLSNQFMNYLEKYLRDEDWTINKEDFIGWKNKLLPILNEYDRRQKEIAEQEYIASVDLKHKYSHVRGETGVSGMLDLWTNEDYTQVVGGGGDDFMLHGRGTYTRNGNKIYFSSTSGITFNGQARISIENGKVVITLPNGMRYIQDDEGYYIKNSIPTNR